MVWKSGKGRVFAIELDAMGDGKKNGVAGVHLLFTHLQQP